MWVWNGALSSTHNTPSSPLPLSHPNTSPPDSPPSCSSHEHNGWVSGVGIGVENVKDEAPSAVRSVHRSRDEHSDKIQPFFILYTHT